MDSSLLPLARVSWPLTAAKLALSVSNLMIASPVDKVSSTTPSSVPVLGFGGTGRGFGFVFFFGDFARIVRETTLVPLSVLLAELALPLSGFDVFPRALELLLARPASPS